MPLCQSALVGYLASFAPVVVDSFREQSIGNKRLEKQRAIACALAGGGTSVISGDPIGALLVAIETNGHLKASKKNIRFEDRRRARLNHGDFSSSPSYMNPENNPLNYLSPLGSVS